MSDYKFFYQFSENDLNLDIPEINLNGTSIVGVVENDRDEGLKSPDHFRYFKLPKSHQYPLDLNAGIQDYKYRTDYNYVYTLDELCSYLMSSQPDKQNNAEDLDIITHRGCLARLMHTPYHIRGKWRMSATKYKNKLYLIICNVRDFVGTKPVTTVRPDRETHHFKFQQYCFSNDPTDEPDTSVPVDEENQLYCIYRSQLLNLNLVYSAEINGILCDEKIENWRALDHSRFVHTKLLNKHTYDCKTEKNKLDWWAKAYLVNVNDIYVGKKCKKGFVSDPLEHVDRNTLTLNQKWSPKICINFLHTFITKVSALMYDVNCPHTSYEFQFSAERVNFKIHEGKTKYSFLREEYVAHIQQI